MVTEYKRAPIKLIILRQNGKKIDFTSQVTSITWAGDENTDPRQLDVTMMNTTSILRRRKHQDFNFGDLAFLYSDGKEIFRGMIFQRTTNSDGTEQFTAYDNLIYLSKGQDTVLYKNKPAHEIVRAQLQAAGIPINYLAGTNYTVKKMLCEGMSRSEIITNALEEATNNTGEKFKLRSELGKARLTKRKGAAKSTISVDDVISSSNKASIEDLVTQVLVTKGSLDSEDKNFKSVKLSNDPLLKKYGYLQQVITVDDKASLTAMKVAGTQHLRKGANETIEISIEFVGDVNCITGNKIEIKDTLTRLSSEYYISSDSHTWENGMHTMSLQLSKRL